MNMKINALRSFLATLAVVGALVAMAGTAQAGPVDVCKMNIKTVQDDLNYIYYTPALGGIGGGNPLQTYTSLSSKLSGAITKLDQHKYADAQQKLQDFKTAVISMRDAAKPKLSQAAAALLLDGNNGDDYHTGVNGAIECVVLLP